MRVNDPRLRDRILAKYGGRERKRVEVGLKRLTTLLAEVTREYNHT